MDALRLTAVSKMLLSESASGADPSERSLQLTAHHLIFRAEGKKHISVGLPLLYTCTRLPSNLTGTSHPLLLRTRTFKSYHLAFSTSDEADGVWHSLKSLCAAIGSSGIESTHAFAWEGPEDRVESGWKGKAKEGWRVFEPEREWERMGLGERGRRSQAWRVSTINSNFEFCPSYAAKIVVPAKISDTTLTYAVKYRSKGRIPGLVYLHWANHGSITRSSQPMVGITQGARSIQDEKLIEAIFTSHAQHTKTRAAFSVGSEAASVAGASGEVYGAQATNVIIDARPSKNAYANSVKGAGTENMAYYKNCKKEYLGIDNIHVMRASLNDIQATLRDADATGQVDRYQLNRSYWLTHLTNILDGVLLIVRTIHLSNSHVLVHCSDGWDRTSQLSALPQLCLDPYYRTALGLAVLIEKDWVSYGHRFSDRTGVNCGDRVVFTSPPPEGASAQATFLASVQKQFASSSHAFKETCPVFQQFLDCIYQLMRQFPHRFEWNVQFLIDLSEEVYAGRSGTFLFNSEKQRAELRASERTHSVWESFFDMKENGKLELKAKYKNSSYDRSLDDPDSRSLDADQGVLLPQPSDVKWWFELFGRSDEEMNGRPEEQQRLREAASADQPEDLGVGAMRIAANDGGLAPPLVGSPGRSVSPGNLPESLPSQAQLAEVVGSVQKWGWGAFKSVQKGYQEGVKQYREASAAAQSSTPSSVVSPPLAVDDPWRSTHAQETSNSGWKAEQGAEELDVNRSALSKPARKPLSERLSEIAAKGASRVPSNPWANDPLAAEETPKVNATERSSAPAREAISRPVQNGASAPPAPPQKQDDPFDPLAGLAPVMSSPTKSRQQGGNPWAVKEEEVAGVEPSAETPKQATNGASGGSDPLGVGPL